MEVPTNFSRTADQSNTNLGVGANRASMSDAPIPPRLRALATSIGATDPLQAVALAGYTANEPLGRYASYTALQVAAAQNEQITQCTAGLRSEMAAITERLDTMYLLLGSAGGRGEQDVQRRDGLQAGFGPSASTQVFGEYVFRAARPLESTHIAEWVRRLVEEMGRVLQHRVEESARELRGRITQVGASDQGRFVLLKDQMESIEKDLEKRLLDAIRASEEKTEKRYEKKFEELGVKLSMVEAWIRWVQDKADNLEGRTEDVGSRLDGMEKKVEALSRKFEDTIKDLAEKIKVIDERVNDIQLDQMEDKPDSNGGQKTAVEGTERPEDTHENRINELRKLLYEIIARHPATLRPRLDSNASNQARSALGTNQIMVRRTDDNVQSRQASEQTNSRIEGLEKRFDNLMSRVLGSERWITRFENSQRGDGSNLGFMDVPCSDGSYPTEWSLNGENFPALRNIATIEDLSTEQCAYALTKYGCEDIPEDLQDCKSRLRRLLGIFSPHRQIS